MKADYVIRKMTAIDLPAVMNIENEVFTIPWSFESYMSELKNQWASYQVCERNGQVVGYAGIWVVFEEARITNVAVSPQHCCRGLGRALMLSMEKISRNKNGRRILLEVRPSNEVAIKLYYSLGYYEVARRKAYYADNQEDALILCKDLEDKAGEIYA